MRVAVPFGKSKVYTAIVAGIHTTAPLVYEAKEIHQILDETPLVSLKQLELWAWISNYYLCSEGEVMRAALPNAFLLESETLVVKNTVKEFDAASLKDDEFLVYEALQKSSSIKINELEAVLNKRNL